MKYGSVQVAYGLEKGSGWLMGEGKGDRLLGSSWPAPPPHSSPLWTESHIYTSENITFPRTTYVVGNESESCLLHRLCHSS